MRRKGNLHKVSWRLFNSRTAVIIFTVCVVFWPIIRSLMPLAHHSPSMFARIMAWGVTQSIFAGAVISWWAFTFRFAIRRFFQPQITYIRAPLMLAVAPLIVSRKAGIWESHGLNMDLDFRYAGESALQDLLKGDCEFAVASDIALCAFLTQNTEVKLKVIPFVKITDNLKVLVRQEDNEQQQIKSFEDLQEAGRKIGYHPDSVHDDFIEKFLTGISKDNRIKVDSVLDSYNRLSAKRNTDTIDACIFWEPHYRAFQDFKGIKILNEGNDPDYKWFLCLVAKEEYIASNKIIAERVRLAVEGATNYCKNHPGEIIDGCKAFLHTEFTGVGEKELKEIMDKQHHHFGIDDNSNEFYEKMGNFARTGYTNEFGAARLRESLWDGVHIRKISRSAVHQQVVQSSQNQDVSAQVTSNVRLPDASDQAVVQSSQNQGGPVQVTSNVPLPYTQEHQEEQIIHLEQQP